MKNSTTHLVLSFIVLLFVFGCGKSPEKSAAEDAKAEDKTTTISTDQSNDGNTTSADNQTKTIVLTACDNPSFELMANIDQSVEELTGTPYSRELKNDCSGIFHQVLDGMRDECPNVSLPTIDEARSSRHIAGWYEENGNFKIIRDPKSQGDLIKPGMVMFYGHAKRAALYNYQTMTIDTLTARGTGINHVAIVTEVTRDENGVLQSYVMFHGKNVGKPAGTTISRMTYDDHPELPVYGNWGEPWLAIAQVLAPKQ